MNIFKYKNFISFLRNKFLFICLLSGTCNVMWCLSLKTLYLWRDMKMCSISISPTTRNIFSLFDFFSITFQFVAGDIEMY